MADFLIVSGANGTALDAVPAQYGGTLTQVMGTPGTVVLAANRAHTTLSSPAPQLYRAAVSPSSTDYDITITAHHLGGAGSKLYGCINMQPNGDCYAVMFNRDATQVTVRTIIGGVEGADMVTLANGYSPPTNYTLRLYRAAGKLYVQRDGGTPVEAATLGGDALPAGEPGIGFLGVGSSTTGQHLISAASSAYSGGGGGPNTPPTVAITSPTAQSVTVPSGTRLQVSATASDQQGTDIGNSIAWSSSNAADVPAGGWAAGGTLIIDTTGWANGTRTITANVTDAGGLPATPDSFTLMIGAGSTLILEDDVQQEILQGGTAATVRVALRDSTGAVLESNPLSPGDVKKSVDGGAPAVLAGDAGAAAWTVVNGFLNVPLTAAEVTGSEITLFIEDQDGSAYLDRAVKIMVVGYDPRATPASTTQIAGAVGDALSARLAS